MATPRSVEQTPATLSDLLTAARSCPAMVRIRRLAEWVGAGQELTARGVLKPASAVEVCGLLGIELPSAKPRSALDVPELMALWKTAIAAEFIEIADRRVRTGPGLRAWGSADPDTVLRIWAKSTIGAVGLVEAEDGEGPEGSDGTECLILLHGLYERDGVATLDDLAEARQESFGIETGFDHQCLDCGRFHGTPNPFDLLEFGADDVEFLADAARRLEEFGAVTLHDRTLELTPLGWMLATVMFRDGAPGPETDVSTLVGTLAVLPPEIATTMVRPWLDGRPLTDRVGELLTFAESATGQDRLAALTLAQSAGDDETTAPAWREWKDRPGFGAYARQWLAERGESVEIQPTDEAWLAADTLATMLSALPPDLPIPLLTAMMQADLGADVTEVLPMLRASGHPAADELVRLLGGTGQGAGRRGPATKRVATRRKRSDRPASSAAYRLKISLRGVSKPPVWRRVLVPDTIRLDELHEVILHAMGWLGGHLHVFEKDWTEYGTPDPELGHEDERGVFLSDLLAASGDKLRYTYDFGDGWEHDILLERSVPLEPDSRYPRCLAGKGACPPEDCGGVWGYADLKEIIADPAHEDHDDMLEWLGLDSADDFDPASFSVDDVNARLEHIRKTETGAKRRHA